MATWPSQQQNAAPAATEGGPPAGEPATPPPTPQIGDTRPAPEPVQSPASVGTNSVPVPGTPPAPGDLPPGTGEPAATAPATVEEAEAIEGVTDIAEANKIIKKLRDENARRRVQNNDIDRVFEGADDRERAAILDLVNQLRHNPGSQETRDRLADMVSKIDAHLQANAPAFDEPDEAPEALTPDQVEAILDRRERERRQQAFHDQAVNLGYPEKSPDYGKLMHIAATEYAGEADPISAAHAHIQGELQAYRDQVIAEYIADVQAGRPVTTPTGQGSPPAADPVLPEGVDNRPLSELPSEDRWKQARQKARARGAAASAGQRNNPLVT